MAVYTDLYMAMKGRIEYTQAIGADWQLSAVAFTIAIVVIAFVGTFYQPTSSLKGGSVQSATDRLGQLKPTTSPLQKGVGNTQRSTTPFNASGGLQAAGSAEVFEEYNRGDL